MPPVNHCGPRYVDNRHHRSEPSCDNNEEGDKEQAERAHIQFRGCENRPVSDLQKSLITSQNGTIQLLDMQLSAALDRENELRVQLNTNLKCCLSIDDVLSWERFKEVDPDHQK